MLLLLRIAPVIVLAVLVQYAYGYQRVVTMKISEQFSDDHDFNTSVECCLLGSCPCHSFVNALINLTCNVLLDITTNVTFTSVIHVSNLANISIIGHSNPTMHCRGVGGIHFTSCHNCIIQGITWMDVVLIMMNRD